MTSREVCGSVTPLCDSSTGVNRTIIEKTAFTTIVFVHGNYMQASFMEVGGGSDGKLFFTTSHE